MLQYAGSTPEDRIMVSSCRIEWRGLLAKPAKRVNQKKKRESAYREAGAQEAFALFDIGQPSGRVITAVVVLHSRRYSWVQPRPMRWKGGRFGGCRRDNRHAQALPRSPATGARTLPFHTLPFGFSFSFGFSQNPAR